MTDDDATAGMVAAALALVPPGTDAGAGAGR
jgi:hypothetical protein